MEFTIMPMSLIRNLFSHQKHSVRKVCISHDTNGDVEFNTVADSHLDSFSIDTENNAQHKNKNKKKGEKYCSRVMNGGILHNNNNDIVVHNGAKFHCPNALLETGSTLEDLDEDNHNVVREEKLSDHARRSLTHGYCPGIRENNNVRLIGTTHPSYLQTSQRSAKINATCYCSNDIDDHFKPTPIHIFCAGKIEVLFCDGTGTFEMASVLCWPLLGQHGHSQWFLCLTWQVSAAVLWNL